jgi:hypothetical protein
VRFPQEGTGPQGDAGRGALLVLALLPILAGAAAMLAAAPLDVSRPATWPALVLASGGWLTALVLARRLGDSPALLVVVACGALALRLLFLAGEFQLSDDIHRYAWEGALVGAGVDPYGAAPEAPELAAWRARWPETFARVNHPAVPAAYPPLAQGVHAAVVALAGGPEPGSGARLGLRLVHGASDLLVCVPLAILLRQRRRPLALLVAWAWNPWVALEFAGSGHLDALAILCLLSALACLRPLGLAGAGRASLALVFLAAGAAVKLLPAALVPFALRRARRPYLAALAGLAGLALALAPFVLATGALPSLTGLGEYAFRWESFSLAYRGLEPLLERFGDYDEAWNDPRRLGRALVLLAWLALGVRAWRLGLEPARAAAWLVGGFLLLTPTLHPWYLAWIVPFLALRPMLGWSLLVALAPLLYWPVARWRVEGVWSEPGWLWPVLVLALLGGGVLDLLRARRSPGAGVTAA